MRIILDIDEEILGKLQFQADQEKRSRKNYMELALQTVANGNNPILQRTPIAEVATNVKIPKSEPIYVPPINQFEAYAQEINEARSHEQLKRVVDCLNADNTINKNQKIQLNQLATFVASDKGLYANG